jgi:hypothetical protein
MNPSDILVELRRRAAAAKGEEQVLTVKQKVEAMFEAFGIRLVGYSEGRNELGELLVKAHPHINDLYTAAPFTADQMLVTMKEQIGGECFYSMDDNSFTSRLVNKKTLAEAAQKMMATQDEQIANLTEMLDTAELLNVMLKRALRQLLLELPTRRASIEIDISDLEIPDAPPTTRFYLTEDDELDME